MQTVKLNAATIGSDTTAAMAQALANIARGNAMTAEGKKLCDNGKAYLASKLSELRGIEVAKLEIGELVAVSVDGTPLFNVVIGKQNRLDSARLEAEQPEIALRYKRDFPTVSYKAAK